MRSTTTRKLVAAAYGLGLIWTAAIVVGAVVLTAPLAELYAVLGIESAAIHVALTMSVDILVATSIAATVGLLVRAAASHMPVMHRAGLTPGTASHRV